MDYQSEAFEWDPVEGSESEDSEEEIEEGA